VSEIPESLGPAPLVPGAPAVTAEVPRGKADWSGRVHLTYRRAAAARVAGVRILIMHSDSDRALDCEDVPHPMVLGRTEPPPQTPAPIVGPGPAPDTDSGPRPSIGPTVPAGADTRPTEVIRLSGAELGFQRTEVTADEVRDAIVRAWSVHISDGAVEVRAVCRTAGIDAPALLLSGTLLSRMPESNEARPQLCANAQVASVQLAARADEAVVVLNLQPTGSEETRAAGVRLLVTSTATGAVLDVLDIEHPMDLTPSE